MSDSTTKNYSIHGRSDVSNRRSCTVLHKGICSFGEEDHIVGGWGGVPANIVSKLVTPALPSGSQAFARLTM